MSKTDVSVIVTFHDEDFLVGATIASLRDCVLMAQTKGLEVELLFALDTPTDLTRRLVESQGNSLDCDVLEFDFGDQGLVRNSCVQKAEGKYIAFLDGDDLFGYDWLWRGCEVLAQEDGKVVHPELNIYFEGRRSIFVHRSSTDPFFDLDYFRVGNYWDAMCMSERSVLLDFPYRERDIELGFAYEDWDWNMRTLASGIHHLVATDTVHFKRSRKQSQSKVSRDRGVVFHHNSLSFYKNYSSIEKRLSGDLATT